jgi:hypothetical protein
MNEKPITDAWIQAAKARGWNSALLLMMDVIEPISPLASQMLWVVQPMAGVFGAHEAIREIAEALETPEGLKTLRDKLGENEMPQASEIANLEKLKRLSKDENK